MINSRESANKYYALVNDLIDSYIEKWNIRPSSLYKYLKPGSDRFNKFIDRNNLTDVKGINIILRDVIEDRCGIENDGIMKFENYNINDKSMIDDIKKCVIIGIEKSNINHEKALADVFKSSLSDINIIDSDKHLFEVDDWDELISAIIYSNDDLDIITANLSEYYYNYVGSKSLKLYKDIKLEIGSVINFEDFDKEISKILKGDVLIDIISIIIGYKFYKSKNGFVIFKK